MNKILLVLALWSSPIVGFFSLIYPNQYIKMFGLGYALLGTSIPIALVEKLPQKDNQRLQKLLEQSDKNYQELSYENDDLKATMQSAIASKIVEINTLNQQIGSLESEISTLKSAILHYQSTEDEAVRKIADCQREAEQLEIEKQKFEITRQKLEIERASYQNALDKQVIQNQYTLEKSSDKIAELQNQIRELGLVNQQLNQQIAILKAENNKPKNKIACLIFELFIAKSLRVEYLFSSDVAGIRSHFFKPLSLDYLPKLDEIAKELPGLSDEISKVPSVKVADGKIAFIFDDRNPIDRVNFAPKSWVLDLAVSDENLLILGARGSGKSELAINYLNLLYQQYPRDFVVNFCQPKPDDCSSFVLPDGQRIIPKYVGFEDCLSAVYALNDHILDRNKKREVHYKKHQTTLHFDAEFWLIDEFQQLIFQAENFGYKQSDISQAIKNVVSLGRSLKVYVLCIGQIPNVSQFPKWNKADFYQFSQVYLGDAVKVGIDYIAANNDEIKALKNDYQAISNSAIKYYALIRNNSKNSWVILPPPVSLGSGDAVDRVKSSPNLEVLPSIDSSDLVTAGDAVSPRQKPGLSCPDCTSQNVSKNGKRGDKQRYKCKDCGKTFVEN